jgi:hypothetical protein
MCCPVEAKLKARDAAAPDQRETAAPYALNTKHEQGKSNNPLSSEADEYQMQNCAGLFRRNGH